MADTRPPFDNADGYSGQDYRAEDAAALAADDPSGSAPSTVREAGDAGKRASVDAATGEVRGSGAGAGADDDEGVDDDRPSADR